MENRSNCLPTDPRQQDRRKDGPQPIGEILAELLAQYEVRFPEVHIAVVETPVAVF